MKKPCLLSVLLLLIFILSGACSRSQRGLEGASNLRDTIYVHKEKAEIVVMHDTITMPRETIVVHRINNYVLPPTPTLDSLTTQRIMENSLVDGKIEFALINGEYTELFYRKDLEYMPYMMASFSSPDLVFDSQQKEFLSDMIDICSHTISDDLLYEYGKKLVDIYNKQIEKEPPLVNPRGKVIDRRMPYPMRFSSSEITAIDSLRVKALFHNSREALTKLEEHYRDLNYELGIAIYYKLMLDFDGNGDLAERFYRVVEPHFANYPGFQKASQEMLRLAALRDNNQRARELCDSLGYKLTEYQ